MWQRHRLILIGSVPVIALSLLAAGCGGGHAPRVANVTTTNAATTTTSQNGLLAFSQCMRSNGVPSFPDPAQYSGGNVKLTIHQSPGSGSPRFHAAMNACGHLLPTTGQDTPESAAQTAARLADALSFARCMRSHGVSQFPDPTSQGQLTIEMVQSQGIDIHSPAVLRVVQQCLPASHGMLTPAKVRQALAEAGSG
jgi:hypothetical protein